MVYLLCWVSINRTAKDRKGQNSDVTAVLYAKKVLGHISWRIKEIQSSTTTAAPAAAATAVCDRYSTCCCCSECVTHWVEKSRSREKGAWWEWRTGLHRPLNIHDRETRRGENLGPESVRSLRPHAHLRLQQPSQLQCQPLTTVLKRKRRRQRMRGKRKRECGITEGLRRSCWPSGPPCLPGPGTGPSLGGPEKGQGSSAPSQQSGCWKVMLKSVLVLVCVCVNVCVKVCQ